MSSLFSFHTRSNFLSRAFLILRTTKTHNPNSSNRLLSIQSQLSVAEKPLITSPPPPPPPLPSASHFSPNPNPNSDSNDFTTICDLLANLSFPPGPALGTALDRAGIEVGSPLLQRVFDHSDFSSSPKLLLSLFMWAERRPGYQSSVGVFNAMIKALVGAREFKSVWCLIIDRLKRGMEGPDLDTFAIVIRRYARAGMPSHAIRTLEFASSLGLVHNSNSELNLFEILLDCFCMEGLVWEASEYFNRKRRTDPSWVPSIRVYNILLTGWIRSRQFERMECLWDEMKKKNVKPSVVTYGTFVEGYCQMCRVEVAIELVGEMRRDGIEPNVVVYNPLIAALGEAGRFKEALAMLERSLVSESGPTISTYNSLVKCFCRADDLEGANKILKMMISRGFMPTTTTYNYFLGCFSKTGKFEEGLNLYTKMMKSGYTPDRLTYHLLINLVCKQERLDLAMEGRKEMKARGYDLNSTVSTMLVHLLCRMHRFEEAFREFEDMIQRGIVPHYVTYQRMADELKEQGMMEISQKLGDMLAAAPHSVKLPNTYAGDEDATRVRRASIIRKAKVMSDTLKTCKDPRELVKHRRYQEKR